MNSRRLAKALQKEGLVLLSDPALPNVVSLVAGTHVRGSWWSHKKGHEIFQSLKEFDSNPDALVTRLVSGKVTYMHRRLWPHFLSVATARGDWQLRGLSAGARRLLNMVERDGEVRTDKVTPSRKLGDSARELERRLLVYSEEIHTERGSHAKLLMTWSRCPKIAQSKIRLIQSRKAMDSLERILGTLNERHHGRGRLPWQQH